MKKFIAVFLFAVILLSLCACAGGKETLESEPTSLGAEETKPPVPITIPEGTVPADSDIFRFPNGSTICGVDVSGMPRYEAYTTINAALDAYKLSLTVNGRTITVKGSDIQLSCPESGLILLIDAITNGDDPSDISLLTYDSTSLRHTLAMILNTSAQNASIRYNQATDSFELTEDSSGKTLDVASVAKAADPVILTLGSNLTINVSEEVVEASIKADSQEAKQALTLANSYLETSLIYSYTPDDKPTQYETLTKDDIGSFIGFSNNLTSYISSSALRSYVNRMSSKYSVKGDAGQFKTSGGYYITLTVDYAGQPVNTDALYDDIYYCITSGISGTRVAPYLELTECEDMAFDGNYVEVNLSAQHLWVYRNGNCVVSTPIVSGCAYYHNTTPTGVYSIYGKSRNVNLVGETWNSFVNYWMPFRGGYGLHDASWRSEFGGDIYLYDGSHGCVNIPSWVAGSVYDNVDIGTKVILYGGATSAEPVHQNVIGTSQYDVPLGTTPFALGAQPEYGENKTLTYSSDNPQVAEVSADGTVTVKAIGTAHITVIAEEREYYTAAQLTVTINVYDGCSVNEHPFGSWENIIPATCTTDGSQTRTCKLCGHTETEVLPAAHSFSDWVQVTAPTCSTEGQQKRACGRCGTEETQALPASGHSVSTWNVDVAPGCETEGSQSGICGNCGETITETIPITGHSFTSGEFCDNGCGTADPSLLPPQDEDPTLPPDNG